MHIELKFGALHLARGQVLRVVDGEGTTVCAREGTLWVTEEDRPRDVVLSWGGSYRLVEHGVAVIQALGEASVSLA